MMPNGNCAGGEQLDNQLDRYMYGLSLAHSPRKSSLNIPAESFPKPSHNLPLPNMAPGDSSDLMFPPVSPEVQDQSIVPNIPSGGEAMDNAPPPQGEMQVAPRPLGAPFFMQQQQNEMGGATEGGGGLFRRGGNSFHSTHGRSPFVKPVDSPYADQLTEREKPDPRFGVPHLTPQFQGSAAMMGDRRRGVPGRGPSDVKAINTIFNDIESDENQYQEDVDSNLRSGPAQRKDVVQRNNFNEPPSPSPASSEPFGNDGFNPGQFEQQQQYDASSRFEVPRHNYQTIGSTSMGTSRYEEAPMVQHPSYRSMLGRHNNNNFRSMFDEHIDTGSPQQNALERKYEMVLNSIAVADNFLKNPNNQNSNFEAPQPNSGMGRFREERPMFEEERSQQFRERIPFRTADSIPFRGRSPFRESSRFRERSSFNPFSRFHPTSFEMEGREFPMMSDRKRSTIRKKAKKTTTAKKKTKILASTPKVKISTENAHFRHTVPVKTTAKLLSAKTRGIISKASRIIVPAKTRNNVQRKVAIALPVRARNNLPLESTTAKVVPKPSAVAARQVIAAKAAKVRYAIAEKSKLAARNAIAAKQRIIIAAKRRSAIFKAHRTKQLIMDQRKKGTA